MRSVATMVASLLLLAAAPASAQEPGTAPAGVAPADPAPLPPAPAQAAAAPARTSMPMTLSVRGGMYQPRDDADMMAFFDEGLDLEAALAVQVHRYVAVEVAAGYYRTASDRMTETDPMLGTMTAKFTLSVIPITASVRVGTRLERVSLYALGGVGLHMASLDADVDWTGTFTGSVGDDANAFGLHLGGGLAFDLTPRTSLGLDVRHTFVSATLMDEKMVLDGLRIGAVLAFRL